MCGQCVNDPGKGGYKMTENKFSPQEGYVLRTLRGERGTRKEAPVGKAPGVGDVGKDMTPVGTGYRSKGCQQPGGGGGLLGQSGDLAETQE